MVLSSTEHHAASCSIKKHWLLDYKKPHCPDRPNKSPSPYTPVLKPPITQEKIKALVTSTQKIHTTLV